MPFFLDPVHNVLSDLQSIWFDVFNTEARQSFCLYSSRNSFCSGNGLGSGRLKWMLYWLRGTSLRYMAF